MSLAALSWAWDAELPCARKMVLLALADHADQDNDCFPSQKRLATFCSLARPTINRLLGELERDGWIIIVPRQHASGADRSFVYHLNAPLRRNVQVKPLESPLGCVYVAVGGGRTKVGVSRKAEQRIRGIANAAGFPVELIRVFPMEMPRARRIEAASFVVLAEHRSGGEWFTCSADEAINAIASVIEGDTPPVIVDDTPRHRPRHLGVTQDDTLNLNLTPKIKEARAKPLVPVESQAARAKRQQEMANGLRELASKIGTGR